MELEKKRETKWFIKKKGAKKSFYLRSVEDSGQINQIGVGLTHLDDEIYLEMNPEEFKNFYFILKSFKDLLYSEGLDVLGENHGMEEQESEDENEDLDSLTTRELNSLEKSSLENKTDVVESPGSDGLESIEPQNSNQVMVENKSEGREQTAEPPDSGESPSNADESDKLDPTDWDPW